ncbi:hypothetical protein SISSUDRAFT_1053638, partial [Sistotremastrum suecicum HHB10207 ss-3]
MSGMKLPPEICRTIAEAIRNSSVDALAKTREEWMKENASLLSLLRVSKAWMHETLPVLQSEIVVEAFDFLDFAWKEETPGPTPRFELYRNQLSHILVAMSESESSFVARLTTLSINLRPLTCTRLGVPLVPPPFLTCIKDILSLASRLRYLRFSLNSGLLPSLFFHLPTLHFPLLREVRLVILTCSLRTPEYEGVMEETGNFLLNHPTLQDVSLYLTDYERNLYPWEQLRVENPLPNLVRFRGGYMELSMLASSDHLTTIEYIRLVPESDEPKTLEWEFSQLSGPFIHVTHLSILSGSIVL